MKNARPLLIVKSEFQGDNGQNKIQQSLNPLLTHNFDFTVASLHLPLSLIPAIEIKHLIWSPFMLSSPFCPPASLFHCRRSSSSSSRSGSHTHRVSHKKYYLLSPNLCIRKADTPSETNGKILSYACPPHVFQLQEKERRYTVS